MATTISIPTCGNSCQKYVRGECDFDTGILTYTRECDIGDCQTEYEEWNACPTWSEWEEVVGDCVENKRTVHRTCILGRDAALLVDAAYLRDQNCPGEDAREIDCLPNVYSDTCSCDGSVGTLSWSCVAGENLHPEDICENKANEDCSNFCPVWTEWGEWTAVSPECIDIEDIDNFFNDFDKNIPTRTRERECRFSDGALAYVNHESGNCPASDKTEQQTLDVLCPPPFEESEIEETVIYKYIIVIQFVIFEAWTSALQNPQSDAFTDLAEIYTSRFLDSLRAISQVDSSLQIQFETLRAVRFVLLKEDFVRRRRSVSRDKIQAEFEAVYIIVHDTGGQKTEDKRIIIEASEEPEEPEEINNDVDEFSRYVSQTIVEILKTIYFEQGILSAYSSYIVLDCNCTSGLTTDHYECVATKLNVSFIICYPYVIMSYQSFHHLVNVL